MKKAISVFVFWSSVLVTTSVIAGEKIQHQTMTVSDQLGRSIEITMVYSKNDDGSKTVLRVEPQAEARAFFNQACRLEDGPDSRYVEPDGNLRLSGTASFSYTCQSE